MGTIIEQQEFTIKVIEDSAMRTEADTQGGYVSLHSHFCLSNPHRNLVTKPLLLQPSPLVVQERCGGFASVSLLSSWLPSVLGWGFILPLQPNISWSLLGDHGHYVRVHYIFF
jgi:hypothetical protein